MTDTEWDKITAQVDALTPDGIGGDKRGNADAAPMACHIGHITPKPFTDGELTIEIWAKHVRVKRPSHTKNVKAPRKRGAINGMSPRASRRLRWAIENTPALTSLDALFICLTYPAAWPKDGRTVKRHLDVFGKRCRRVNAFFAWVLEYQSRGAPHFHLLACFPKEWDIDTTRQWIALNWFEIVDSKDEKHLHAGTSVERVNIPEQASWYLSHYLGKEYQKRPPADVTLPGRMWGCIGCKPPKPERWRFSAEMREGVEIVRMIRRWASSDHAFRQRTRHLSAKERLSDAKYFKDIDPALARIVGDIRNYTATAYVEPENRKRWSPHDCGREKGFLVRNAAKVTLSYFLKSMRPF